jgi:hypothetical protein
VVRRLEALFSPQHIIDLAPFVAFASFITCKL